LVVFTMQGSEESNGALSVSMEMLQFVPDIRSGSFSDIGPRRYMEDEHIRIDDLSAHLGSLLACPLPSAFYGVSSPLCVLMVDLVYQML
jgi:protein phosphatase PTC2/3